jgi:signal transduction histidine kinase
MSRFDGVRRDQAVDAAIALGAFAFTLFLLVVPEDEGQVLDGFGVLLAALATLPLYLRRRAPLAVFVFTTLASALLLLFEYPQGPPIGPTIALYFVALTRAEIRGSSLLTIGLVVVMYGVHVGGFAIAQGSFPGAEVVLGIPLWAAVWFAGDRTRLRRERMAELEERAERAEREAERERRLAAAVERTRIARDLHDSAGHAINVILVHAGAARVLSEKDPERSRTAVETIETVARETLTEIDRLVRVLRDDGAVDGDAVRPPTGLAALDALGERHRAAGLDVSISTSGTARQLAPAVDQAAFRIVQESLTNALLHGRGETMVQLSYGGEALDIAVTNPIAPEARTAGGGHGIVGMHERAALVGGTFETSRDDGVFRVRAQLPYAREAER